MDLRRKQPTFVVLYALTGYSHSACKSRESGWNFGVAPRLFGSSHSITFSDCLRQ
jgi:hypothetical protein